MKLDYPGLYAERRPNGRVRYVVRKAGDKASRITLSVEPTHPKFREHYHAARMGIRLNTEPDAPSAIKGSIGWLVDLYCAELSSAVDEARLHKVTAHQRTVFLTWLRAEVGEYSLAMPQTQLIILRDKKAATPGAADNFIKSVRAMYAWAIPRGHAKSNPACGIGKINRGTGAVPWSVDDLKTYRAAHPPGTMAHLALSLFMFTACRISDAVLLGRQHEVMRDGATWLEWQPEKRGSKRVAIPMAAPLAKAVRAQTVIGPTYLMTERGKSFSTPKSFARRFAKWCEAAGLEDRTSHGIRKAAGYLMAEAGVSQYAIMSIHGHASAKTSEVYTAGADRARLASLGMGALAGIEW